MALLEAHIGDDWTITLVNRTGHPENFFVSGALSDVYINLDGNTRYSTNLRPRPESTIVEVRHEGPDGRVLAHRRLDQEDDADVS